MHKGSNVVYGAPFGTSDAPFLFRTNSVITAAQMRAGRALLGIDQRRLAELAGLSLTTIQRMEASDGTVRSNVESLMRVVDALNRAGVVLIGDGAPSAGGGRGVRLRQPEPSPR
jgi:transcriptional regulator with XRE-family HTH domain